MRTTHHNKLIRDHIPDLIRAEGNIPHTLVMDDEEYGAALVEKLHEETGEFSQSHSAEELADILEVFLALAEHHGYTLEQIQAIRARKKESNGGFSGKLFLTTVDRIP